MMALYLVLIFGWVGSPGEWVVWSWALMSAFGSRGPAEPERHDLSSFFCHFLVDDQILAEPDLGVRWWMAGRVADRRLPLRRKVLIVAFPLRIGIDVALERRVEAGVGVFRRHSDQIRHAVLDFG